MENYQDQFLEFVIRHEILRFGEFTLKSGRKSPYFFNAGLFNTGAALATIGRCYAAAIQAARLEYDVIFGPAYKGIPLAAATAIALAGEFNVDKPWCFNRKEVKDHGEGGATVGASLQGRVLIIDDVITAGTAVGEAMEIIASHGAVPAAVVVALDRQEKGREGPSAVQEVECRHGVPVLSIISLDRIVAHLEKSGGEAFKQHLPRLKAYQDTYGV